MNFKVNPDITLGNILTIFAILITIITTQLKINETVNTLQAKTKMLEETVEATSARQQEDYRELKVVVEETYVRKDYLEAVLLGIDRILIKLDKTNADVTQTRKLIEVSNERAGLD